MKRGFVLFLLSALLAASLAACAQAPSAEPQSRILYFTHRTDAEASLLAPGRLRTALGAQAVGEWGDLMVLHAAQPAEAVIIDGAAAVQANADDLARLYRECVVLAFFNLYTPDIARLVNDPSVRGSGLMDGSEPHPGDFYMIVHRQARTDDEGCAADALPSELTGLGKGFSQHSMASEEDLEVFVGVMRTHLSHPQP
ncbi:MAG: hypothetical protein KIT70_09305 [Anaerolineales bacterium]|nr:MAG: hypothetical protein KIT70_09305 [Anaerolineales bacterium]